MLLTHHNLLNPRDAAIREKCQMREAENIASDFTLLLCDSDKRFWV